MEITSRAELATDPQTAFAMMTNQEFLEQVCRNQGAQTVNVTVNGDTTVSEYALPAPAQAQKFLGATMPVKQTIAWGPASPDGARTGQFELIVPGQPVRMTGTASLHPGGAGTVADITGDLKVNIPFMGKQIEQMAAPAIKEGIEVQQRTGQEWLASH